ncbi:MAG: FG-GAP repeat protein [Acidobacteria bacterium]|nr:FG-GAP repeat protein [Acidobacteriota bacterium]
MNIHRSLTLVTAFLSVSTVAPAQQPVPLFVLQGAKAGDNLGYSVAGIGDLNGDGTPDLVVGVPAADSNGLTDAGTVEAFSGVDGSPIWSRDGFRASAFFGTVVVAIGDVDDDGVPDVVAAAPASLGPAGIDGYVQVLSGVDGSVVREIDPNAGEELFGLGLAVVGDVNGDLVDDFLVGAPGRGGSAPGVARLISGADGQVLRTLAATGTELAFGRAVAGVGDVDGDLVPDFLIGAPYSPSKKGTAFAGVAHLFSGATGAILRTFAGTRAAGFLGLAVAGPGDVDGDGVPDYFVGSFAATVDHHRSAGKIVAYSGASGVKRYALKGRATGDVLGSAIAGVGDVDGDGRDDVAVSSLGPASGGLVRVFSSAKRSILFAHTGNPNDLELQALSAIGDVSGDGRPDLVVGAWNATPGKGFESAGEVLVFALP